VLIAPFFFGYARRAFLFRGTLAPARRACDNPMAMACLRLFTFLPERPLLKVPRFRSCMAFRTFADAFLLYFAIIIPPFGNYLGMERTVNGKKYGSYSTVLLSDTQARTPEGRASRGGTRTERRYRILQTRVAVFIRRPGQTGTCGNALRTAHPAVSVARAARRML
jgi:hypothetical protein